MKKILLLIAMATLFISPMSALASEDSSSNTNNQKDDYLLWNRALDDVEPQGMEIEVMDMLSVIDGENKWIRLKQNTENPNERFILIHAYGLMDWITRKGISGTEEGLESWKYLSDKLAEISGFSSEILAKYEESSDYNYSFAIVSGDKANRIFYIAKDGEVIFDDLLSIDKREEHNINFE